MRTERSRPNRSVIYGVTIGASAFSLLRGQLGWLREQGWDVTLVTSPDDLALAAADRECVKFEPLPMAREISPLSDLRALVKWIRLLTKSRPFAVNVSTPKAGLLGGIAALVTRVPRRIYVVRGLRLEGASGPAAKILWLSEWLSMKVATDVIFVSYSLSTEASRRRLLNPKKSWVIGSGSSNGVDANAIGERLAEVDRERLRDRLGLPLDACVVGFIGRVARDKGVDTLIEAFESIDSQEIYLLTIGATEDEVLERRIKNLGARVTQVPWTDDVWGHLKAIDVLCLPTLREGYPNVVLEAAAAGIPSITTRATGAVDSVIDGKTGFLVEVGDAESIASRILQLQHDKDLAARLGSAAKARVSTEFQPEQIWRGISGVLKAQESPKYATRVKITDIEGEQK